MGGKGGGKGSGNGGGAKASSTSLRSDIVVDHGETREAARNIATNALFKASKVEVGVDIITATNSTPACYLLVFAKNAENCENSKKIILFFRDAILRYNFKLLILF